MFRKTPKKPPQTPQLFDDPDVALLKSPAQFRRLYERYRGPLMSYVVSMLANHSAAEEVVQEVFLRAYRNRESFKPDAKVSTWLWTIARNATIDHIRGGAGSVPAGEVELEHLESPLPDAETQLLEQVDRAKLESCLAKLPLRQRDALLMRTQSELSYDEIAKVLEVTLSAVKSLLLRARESLLACIQGSAHA